MILTFRSVEQLNKYCELTSRIYWSLVSFGFEQRQFVAKIKLERNWWFKELPSEF